MAKWFILLTLIGATSLFAFVGNNKWNQKVAIENVTAACAISLTTLNGQLDKQKHRYVSYGNNHDYVFKRISTMKAQLDAKRMSQIEFQNQAIELFSSYAPTSMKTCQGILVPSFEKCRANGRSDLCATEAARAFAYALKLVYMDAQSLKQDLDLSKIVAFDVKTAVQQTRPKMSPNEKTEFQTYTAFLQ
jgi:hypothetical protein